MKPIFLNWPLQDGKEIAEILGKYLDLKERIKEMLDMVESPDRGSKC